MTQDLDVNKEFEKGPNNAMNTNEMNKEPIDWPEVRHHQEFRTKSKKNEKTGNSPSLSNP